MAPYPTTIKLSGIGGANGFRIDGVAGDKLGTSAAYGDFNNDGIDDLILGTDRGVNVAGAAFVIYGVASPTRGNLVVDGSFTAAKGLRLNGPFSGDMAGFSVAGAGDINNDNIDDLLVGAPQSGNVYAVFGSSTPFGATLALGSLNGTNGFRFDGASPSYNTGIGVSGAGDINADGIDDFIVGADHAVYGDSANVNGGAAYVIYGKTGPFDPVVAAASMTAATGFRIAGDANGQFVGFAVAAAGDVNGDGIDDLAVGADGYGGSGAAFVIFGSATPFADMAVSDVDGSTGFAMASFATADDTGFSVSSAGDVNGDGLADLIVGAMSSDPGGRTDAGSTFVVFGSAAGFEPALDLGALDGSNGFRIDGLRAADQSGISVSAAGDFNGDGIDDLLVGASSADPGGLGNAGSAYVIFGKATPFAPLLRLSAINGSNGLRIDGVAAADNAGRNVAAAGDQNGDGLADIVVGAPSASPGGQALAGSAYVVFGMLPGESVTRIGTSASQAIRGGDYSDRLEGLDGDDTLYGNGGDDTLLAGFGVDAALGGEGDDSIDGGAGNDSLNGGAGDDTLLGGSGNDSLLGGADADALTGGSGNDTLDGGTGGDAMTGGSGDDIYRVDSAGDSVTEAIDNGSDTVESAVTFSLALSPGVERLTLTGAAPIDGAGNTLNNPITGNGAANVLIGGGGNDTLAGLGGADTLDGGAGNDIYTNPETIDVIIEAAGAAGGTHDRIQTLSSFNIGAVANVEDITLVGAANVNAIGNNLDNILIGNAGANVLNGGGGADTLTGGGGTDTMNGGSGADLFKFAAAGTGTDTINGFETALDRFNLSGGTFSARTEGAGSTILTHSGGIIVITGVTGLSLTQWNALVVNGGREARLHDAAPYDFNAAYRDHAIHAAPGHTSHGDFL